MGQSQTNASWSFTSVYGSQNLIAIKFVILQVENGHRVKMVFYLWPLPWNWSYAPKVLIEIFKRHQLSGNPT